MIYRGRVILRSDRPLIPFSDINSSIPSSFHKDFIIYDYCNARFIINKLYDLQALQSNLSSHIYAISESWLYTQTL